MNYWVGLAVVWSLVLVGCGVNGWDQERQRTWSQSGQASIEPTEADLDVIRGRLRTARVALGQIPRQYRPEWEAKVARAERALARYEALARVGRWRQRGEGLIYAAGTAVVADDVTGLGAADDVFIPFLLVGLLAVHLATEAPAPPAELAQAWGEVIASLEAVGQKAKMEAARMSRRQPPHSDCVAHYSRCLGTRLGNKNSGGKWGYTICKDCLEACQGAHKWPAATGDGKDCQWWNYLQ